MDAGERYGYGTEGRVMKALHVDMDNVLVDFPSGIRQQMADRLRDYEGRSSFPDHPGRNRGST